MGAGLPPVRIEESVMERFVVGTGRCGSTLLSLMLAEHRDVVSIHEFFTGLDWGTRFTPGMVDADALVDVIGAHQQVTTDVLARGYTSDEIQYPLDDPAVRYQRGDEIPWLLVSMIPRLSQMNPQVRPPDDLFDALITEARARPAAEMRDHYRHLFDWLVEEAGGSIWVERSGSSVDYLGDLIDLFPDGRYVHIHRDGREAALSIRDHPFFRLAVAMLFDLMPDTDDEEELIRLLIETPPPVETVGAFWSNQVTAGHDALPPLAADQFHEVRFEDLVTDPVPVLEGIADFFDLPDDPTFAVRASEMTRGLPPARFPLLSAEDQNLLADACRPGQELLGQI